MTRANIWQPLPGAARLWSPLSPQRKLCEFPCEFHVCRWKRGSEWRRRMYLTDILRRLPDPRRVHANAQKLLLLAPFVCNTNAFEWGMAKSARVLAELIAEFWL